MSSIQGRGYCSACGSGFTATLQSPQSLTEPSFLGTGIMGEAQSLHSTLVRIPSFWGLRNFSSTFGFNAEGICQALRMRGWLSSVRVNFALADVNVPSLSSKTSKYLSSIVSKRSLGLKIAGGACRDLKEHQSRRILRN